MAHSTVENSRGRRDGAAKWLIVALLGGLAACLLMQAGQAVSSARAQATTSSTDGKVLVMTGQISPDTFGCYLVDTTSGTMCLYEWVPGTRQLRLMSARNYTFDLKLDEYNTTPSPGEIKKLVSTSRRLDGAANR